MKVFVNIIDYGKVYSTYSSFFKENKISDENYVEGFSILNNKSFQNYSFLQNWEVLYKGKHYLNGKNLYVIEKEYKDQKYKLIIEETGVSFVSNVWEKFWN